MIGVSDALVALYAEMAAHTRPECGQCRAPLSCCDATYCHMAINHAKDHYAVDLPVTGHPTLPLMGEGGCTAAPHFRPICTLHVCCITGLGFKPGDAPWTEKYFDLRDRINELNYGRVEHLTAFEG